MLLLLPAPAWAETWIAWHREGTVDHHVHRWELVESLDPFPTQEDCKQAVHRVLRKLIDAEAPRNLASLRSITGYSAEYQGERVSADGMWIGYTLRIEHEARDFSKTTNVVTYFREGKCWPVGVNPR